MRWYALPLLVAALLFAAACSDDDNGDKDTGPGPDQAISDQGPNGDTGPGNELGNGDMDVADQAVADGPGVQKVEDYVPKDNDVPGWTEDESKGFRACTQNSDCPGNNCNTTDSVCIKEVDAAYTKSGIEDFINGKHDPYAAEGTTGFAGQHYKKDFSGCGATIELMIWDMTTAAGAKKMYDKNKKDGEDNAGLTWETLTNVTTAGIIADDAPGWRGVAHKSTYIILVWAMYSDGACKASLKTDATTFIETLTTKLP